MASETLIYAELLPNIRQVSVLAALGTTSNASTRARLSADGRSVMLTHDDIMTPVMLPDQVEVLSEELPQPTRGLKEVSWRLPLASRSARPQVESPTNDNASPWSASALSTDAEFSCRSCRSTIIRSSSISFWKDLPSENWAEMMDFWHCHKPSNDQNNEHKHVHTDPNTEKGYGADTKLIARPGTGFVDLTYFLLTEGDCFNVEVSSHSLIFTLRCLSSGIKKAAMPRA